jgi:hypothetical protein
MKPERIPHDPPMSADDCLRFLVRFAVMDLHALRPGDWLNLQDDVDRFLEAFERGVSGTPIRLKFAILTDPPPTLEAFQGIMRALQPTIYHILDTVAVDLTPEGAVDVHCFLRVETLPVPQGEFVFCPGFRAVRGMFQDILLRHAQDLIVDSPIEKVAHCRECRTLFYRVRQQVHCSRACTNRVSKRRFRARHAAEHATAAS